jgi:hypothetical protein
MGQAFNAGKRESFFMLWARFVPLGLRSYDLICQKLEFYLHIFFAMYPAFMTSAANKPEIEKNLKRELGAFKEYLDGRGTELSKTSEFLQYYALPYVGNPLEHPTFKSICTKKWASDLREKLKEFLQANLAKNSSPEIFHWYAHFKKRAGVQQPTDYGRNGLSADAEEIRE